MSNCHTKFINADFYIGIEPAAVAAARGAAKRGLCPGRLSGRIIPGTGPAYLCDRTFARRARRSSRPVGLIRISSSLAMKSPVKAGHLSCRNGRRSSNASAISHATLIRCPHIGSSRNRPRAAPYPKTCCPSKTSRTTNTFSISSAKL